MYEAEQDNQRKLETLDVLNSDDLVLEENSYYAFALLINFFKNHQIKIDETDDSEEPEVLHSVGVQDLKDAIVAKYEHSFQIGTNEFKETLEISAQFGNSSRGGLVLRLTQKSGNWLYYKRAAKEIRKLFAYCQK